MKSLEYKALRKITGGYYGSKHSTLAGIAGIEPIERKLDDISTSWFVRSIRTGDTNIRTHLNDPPAPNVFR